MTDLHKMIVGQIRKALGATDRKIGEVMKTAGLSHQWWNQTAKGASPTIRSLEKLSESLGMTLSVELRISTGEGVSVNADTHHGEDDLTDEVLQVARMIDELPEDARKTALGAVLGIVTMARATARPLDPAEGAGVPLGRRR